MAKPASLEQLSGWLLLSRCMLTNLHMLWEESSHPIIEGSINDKNEILTNKMLIKAINY